ncbi:MAG TPA: hypothetical protein VFF30_04165 [Nitrososphaerales archaeon]|nr:hypothetical protein [Nitrososphaerales archaeon]
MGKQMGAGEVDFFESLPRQVDAINELISGLPAERILVHYCYGNWVGSHRFDAEFRRILPELLRLKAGTQVGEMANPRQAGDALILGDYLSEHEWPKRMSLAMGVIDVKNPIVEAPEGVAMRLEIIAKLDKIDPTGQLFGGTDCVFATFADFGNLTHAVAVQKSRSLVVSTQLANKRLGLSK